MGCLGYMGTSQRGGGAAVAAGQQHCVVCQQQPLTGGHEAGAASDTSDKNLQNEIMHWADRNNPHLFSWAGEAQHKLAAFLPSVAVPGAWCATSRELFRTKSSVIAGSVCLSSPRAGTTFKCCSWEVNQQLQREFSGKSTCPFQLGLLKSTAMSGGL